MNRSVWVVIAALWLVGCDEPPCMDGEGIVPGVGISEGGQAVCLGETEEAVVARLGSATVADLGLPGRRLTWSSPDLVAMVADGIVTSLQVGPGFGGLTEGGLGARRTQREGALGGVDVVVVGGHVVRGLERVQQTEGAIGVGLVDH